MKEATKTKISPFDFFVLRTPLLPLDSFTKWSQSSCLSGSAKDLKKEVESELTRLKDELVNIYSDPVLEEALFLASPSLHRSYLKLKQGKVKQHKEERRITVGLVKYFTRMCSRSTPFGLFAGLNVGSYADDTNLCYSTTEGHKRDIRLDMAYVCALAENTLLSEQVVQKLKFYPNSSRYVVKDKLRYVETRIKNKARTHHLVNVDNSEYLEKILNAAVEGALPEDLAKVIVDDEITIEDARGFITDLIENQILVSELEPGVTGEDPFDVLIEKLKTLPEASESVEKLERINSKLNYLREEKLGVSLDNYRSMVTSLRELNDQIDENNYFRVDLVKSPEVCQLNRRVYSEVERGIKISGSFLGAEDSPSLTEFKKAFYERYENREVPLVEALDTELGLGYLEVSRQTAGSVPLLDDLSFPAPRGVQEIKWSSFRNFQFRLLTEALGKGQQEIDIKPEELSPFIDSDNKKRGVYSTMASVYARSKQDLDRGEFKVDFTGYIQPAGRLLGRFTFADLELRERMIEIARYDAELERDVIFAEIVHLPQTRLGNILLRPTLREYEIPYLSSSSVSPEFQIPIQDLTLSYKANRLVLRSKRLNREIVPRLTSAHNYYAGLPVYHLLCDLQRQDKRGGQAWDWGPLSASVYLPRITSGRLVLSKAKWSLSNELISELRKLPDAEQFEKVQELREQHNIPRYVVMPVSDNKLFLDLENPWCVGLFLDEGRKLNPVPLEETLSQQLGTFVQGKGGTLANEIIFPFKIEEDNSGQLNQEHQQPETLEDSETEGVQRTFLPGSEWLYAKVYLGNRTAERVLAAVIKPLADRLSKEQKISNWFFIRYSDPSFHIRFRFRLTSGQHYSEVMMQLEAGLKEFLDSNLIWKVQLDTYNRELERYGAKTIDLAEEFFRHDSDAVVEVTRLLKGDRGEEYRWQIGLFGTDRLLEDFGYSTLQQKLDLIGPIREGFLNEFHADKYLKKQLNDKYRKSKSVIETTLDPDKRSESEIAAVFPVFDQRSAALRAVASELEGRIAQSDAGSERRRIIGSFIHMFLNRLNTTMHRRQEMVLYYFLCNYYRSALARQKSKKK